MKILVTGADGFIGSHLTEMLLKKGYSVRALSYYNSFNNWGWLEGVIHNQLEIVSGDIRDPFFCSELVKGVDKIFHLAALIAIPYSYIAPQSYIETNINGTLNICDAAKKNNIKKVVIASTSEVYGTAKYVPIDENHPKQPQSPYSASKIGADMIALSYYNSFGLPVVIARPFNTYGPRQSARAIIPTIISQISDGKKKIELGDLNPLRDFTFVRDTCMGFIALSESDSAIGQEINISSKSEISIGGLADLIAKKMKSNVEFVVKKERIRPKGSEVLRLMGDNTKLFELTGFKPSITLNDGIEATVTWFKEKNNLLKYKTTIYNI